MGYWLRIIRQHDYDNEDEESNISLNEWLDHIASDPELEEPVGPQLNLPVILDPADIGSFSDAEPGECDWMGHPRSDADTIPSFRYEYGAIAAKYPDKHTIGKMIIIARALNAKVRGGDGEYYDDSFFTNGGYPATAP